MKPTTPPPKSAPATPAAKQSPANSKLNISSQKLSWLLTGALILCIILFFAAVFEGLSVLGSKSQSMVDLKVQAQSGDDQLSNLQVSKQQVKKYAFFKDVAKTVIPNDKNQAEAVVEIYKFASQSGIALKSIAFSNSTLGLSATTATSQQAATSSSLTKAVLSQAKPVSGIPGLYSLLIIVTSDNNSKLPTSLQTTYPKMHDFLQRIENNRRTAQITDIKVTVPEGQPMYFTMELNIFIKP